MSRWGKGGGILKKIYYRHFVVEDAICQAVCHIVRGTCLHMVKGFFELGICCARAVIVFVRCDVCTRLYLRRVITSVMLE